MSPSHVKVIIPPIMANVCYHLNLPKKDISRLFSVLSRVNSYTPVYHVYGPCKNQPNIRNAESFPLPPPPIPFHISKNRLPFPGKIPVARVVAMDPYNL